MKRVLVAALSLVCGVAGSMLGCEDGEDAVVRDTDASVAADGALPDVTTNKDGAGGDSSTTDAAIPPAQPWLLISVNGQTSSDLVVYGVNDKQVAGRLNYPGFIGLTFIDALGRPFLFQQSNDRVVELDPLKPWQARASWDVHGSDAIDGGSGYADPVSLVPVATGKAYVLRFNRNRISVIDDTVKGDATAPVKDIDLTQFFDSSDTDTSVDPIAALAHGGKVYVLLANLDLNNVDPKGFFTICTASKPKIIVIDPATDGFAAHFAADAGPIDAGDGGDAGAPAVVSLLGYNPTFGGMLLDAPRNRLLVVHGGCNTQTADGGKGPLERSQIDAIDLTTGAVTKAVELVGQGFPSAIVPAGGDRVIMGFDFFGGKVLDVASGTFGASLPTGLTAVATDKKGRAFGVVDTALVDGGTAKELFDIPLDGGAPTALGALPDAAGFAGAADYLPAQ